jgi:hypothetical protein
MNTLTRAAILGVAVLLSSASVAATEDNEAAVSLSPSEAAGAWTLETGGHSICVVKLGTQKLAGGAYKAEAPPNCGSDLPAGVAGWTPSAHGMDLVDADGRTLIGFGRWSNSLLVSHPSSGQDVQLRRGTLRASASKRASFVLRLVRLENAGFPPRGDERRESSPTPQLRVKVASRRRRSTVTF